MTRQSTEVVAYDPQLFPVLATQDPEEVVRRFAARFAGAETLDDLFGALEGNTSLALVGHVLEVKAVRWLPYESDRGVIPLAVCDAVDIATGEVIEFATTSMVLTMFIRRAELIDALPFVAKIASKTTRSGQRALNFERA